MDLLEGGTRRSGFPTCPDHGLMVEVKLMDERGELQRDMGPYSGSVLVYLTFTKLSFLFLSGMK
jgi:hypothetical protein